MSRWYLFYPALDNRIGMNDGWPYGILPDKETQLVIRIETMHESSHKATLAWNIQTLWSILLPYQGIKILLQFWGYQFVGINHQYPLAGSSIYGSLPCRFTNLIIASRENNDLATIFTGNIQCIIRTLHIADHYLIEVFYGFQNFSQMLRCIVSIDNNRDSVLCLMNIFLITHIPYKYLSINSC